jgi:hypothetical protein
MYTDHDHRGDYADQRHDHDGDYAERHHRHYDDESADRGLREDLSAAEERVRELADDLRDALNRIHALEDRQPDYASAEEPQDDPDEPSNRELEPEPPGWHDVPEPEERGVSEYNREEFALDRGEEPW